MLRSTLEPIPSGHLGESLKKNPAEEIAFESRRIALERKISLRFPDFQGLITEISSNISMTGMFVRSANPQPAGTLVAFELNLPYGLSLIQGEAEVVWRRLRAEGPDRPPGMGLRFVRLDPESRRLIGWTVDKVLREGGSLFDLDETPFEEVAEPEPNGSFVTFDPPRRRLEAENAELRVSSVPEPPPPPPPEEPVERERLHPYARAAAATSTSKRRPGTAVVLTVALAVLSAAGGAWWLISRPGAADRPDGAASTHAARTANGADGRPEGGPTAGAAADDVQLIDRAVDPNPPPVDAPAERAADDRARLAAAVAAVESWAQAWAGQRVADYLASYADGFRPPRGLERDAWSSERRARILRPRRIQVDLAEMRGALTAPQEVRVVFLQTYASDNYRDQVRKTLDLVFERGRWKILRESSEPVT